MTEFFVSTGNKKAPGENSGGLGVEKNLLLRGRLFGELFLVVLYRGVQGVGCD